MSDSCIDVVKMAAVHPDKIVLYSETIQEHNFKKRKLLDNFKDTPPKFTGKISVNSKRKMYKAIDYLIFLADEKHVLRPGTGKKFSFKISFITLTLPSRQVHSDNEIKKVCLFQFLNECRQRYGVTRYFWRAEKQKNGNIHFHLLVDKFIPWNEIRDRWNRIINKLGYVDRYRESMLKFHSGGFKVREDLLKQWSYKKQLSAYKRGVAKDWYSPNSTDVHALYKINNIKSYVSKYCSKDEKENVTSGRFWGTSESLSNIPGGVTVADSTIEAEIEVLASNANINMFHGEHFTIVFSHISDLKVLGCSSLFKLFCSFILEHFNVALNDSI